MVIEQCQTWMLVVVPVPQTPTLSVAPTTVLGHDDVFSDKQHSLPLIINGKETIPGLWDILWFIYTLLLFTVA